MRYRFFREHKYVIHTLFELSTLMAKTDFRKADDVRAVSEQLAALCALLEGHAMWENDKIHELFRRKNLTFHEIIEQQHLDHEKQLKQLKKNLHTLPTLESDDDKVILGYQIFLAYRAFISDTLRHLHEEETVLMPVLQQHYSDEELRRLDFGTYNIMTPEQLTHMIQLLFPHFDTTDRAAFLADIHEAAPEKLRHIWPAVSLLLTPEEKSQHTRLSL